MDSFLLIDSRSGCESAWVVACVGKAEPILEATSEPTQLTARQQAQIGYSTGF